MNEKRYLELLTHIDSCMSRVSPTQRLPEVSTSGNLFISKDIDVDKLSYNDKILMHTLLHNFYARGGIKNLTKVNIIDLHKKIMNSIPHKRFDILDEK